MSIDMQKVESSQIDAVGHDEATNTLAIEFKGGAVYHYANVNKDMFGAMKAATSIGSFFYREIKPFTAAYPFTKQPPKENGEESPC